MQKKSKETQTIKIAGITILIRLLTSEMTKNRLKVVLQNRDSLNSYRYGIFLMVPGDTSCPGGSEYVWQRGVEDVLGGRS